VIAEIGAFLIPDFFGGRLAALLCDTHVIVDAKFADMQLSPALRAFIEAT
jgi:hypothetical protein